jgi:hypothetical protein
MQLTRKNIANTKNTPEVVLDPDGIIIIKGRSMDKYKVEFYRQIESWINVYASNPAELTRVDIHLEYFNKVNSMIFNSLLKKISEVKFKNKEFIVNWYYEEDDEDVLALGENISSVLDIPFNFIITAQ